MATQRRQLMVCLRNDGYEASLETAQDLCESGEDYLFPAKYFAPVELPQAVRRAVLAAVQQAVPADERRATQRDFVHCGAAAEVALGHWRKSFTLRAFEPVRRSEPERATAA